MEDESGNDIIPLNEETRIALRSETQIALPSEDENQRGVALCHPVIPSFHLNQGSFDKPNFGPQTNTKHIEANTIEHATISHVHHHYGGDGKTEESPSTSGATGARPKQKLEKGFVQLADDIFINTKKPLKEGSKIYEGYQEYVTGQRQRIAIKAIFPCTKKSMREVKHLVTLTPHPNVVRIIQAKENNDHIPTLYIAMELCNSKNLQDYLKENREKNTPFDFKKTMSYCKRLIKGMKHIHRNRIIHGDLKPENILFSLVGDQIKVSDFGISKQLEQAKSKTKRTNQGTDGYRAPETYSSDIISIMADIFSLGVTLYSLWTNGKHPFGENPYQQVVNIINNTGRDLSCLPEEMGTKNDEFIDLLDKMLQVDPKKRPTIEEISQHPFLSSSQATAQASSTRQMSQGTSSEETVPELHFVAPTTPESALAFQETEPKKVREAMLQRPDLGQSPRPENSPEATPTRPETPSTSGATGATRNRTAQKVYPSGARPKRKAEKGPSGARPKRKAEKDYHCPESPAPLIPPTSEERSHNIADLNQIQKHMQRIQDEAIRAMDGDADLTTTEDPILHQNAAGSQADPEKRRLIQNQLVLLLHAYKCSKKENNGDPSNCPLPHCRTMKEVLRHMNGCTQGKSCQVAHCDSSRQIIAHWRACNRHDCDVCLPLKSVPSNNVGAAPNNAMQSRWQARVSQMGDSSMGISTVANHVGAVGPPYPGNYADPMIDPNLHQNASNSSQSMVNSVGPNPDGSGSSFAEPRVEREWHKDVKEELRNHLVQNLVQAIFPTPQKVQRKLVTFARKVEGDMYDQANSRSEYYHLLAEKTYKIQKELKEKRASRKRTISVGQRMIGADHEVGNDHQPSTSIQPAVIEPTSPHVTEIINPNKASPNEEKADELIKHSKYEEAISLLENLPPSKRQQTQILECYFQLKRDSRLPECIETMKMLMMRHPRPKPDDVYELGKTNLQNSSHIKALTFFSCASKLYVLDSKPDDAVLGIVNCTVHCKKVIQAMVGQGDRMRVLAIDIGIGIINETLVDIRSITHAHPDKKADCESHCLKHLGISYRRIKEPEKAIEIYKQGIEIMKRHFGSNASKYRILGHLLHNMGSANDDLGSYCEAEKLYLESLKTYELAQDYASEEVKKTFIDTAQSNLQIVRKKMKK